MDQREDLYNSGMWNDTMLVKRVSGQSDEGQRLPDGKHPTANWHSDDFAVEEFAMAMRAKMAAGRAKGRGGWDDPKQCPTDRLQVMLLEHVVKGDPVDVANFCMMLWARGAKVGK